VYHHSFDRRQCRTHAVHGFRENVTPTLWSILGGGERLRGRLAWGGAGGPEGWLVNLHSAWPQPLCGGFSRTFRGVTFSGYGAGTLTVCESGAMRSRQTRGAIDRRTMLQSSRGRIGIHARLRVRCARGSKPEIRAPRGGVHLQASHPKDVVPHRPCPAKFPRESRRNQLRLAAVLPNAPRAHGLPARDSPTKAQSTTATPPCAKNHAAAGSMIRFVARMGNANEDAEG